jgi:hypothetical protein
MLQYSTINSEYLSANNIDSDISLYDYEHIFLGGALDIIQNFASDEHHPL